MAAFVTSKVTLGVTPGVPWISRLSHFVARALGQVFLITERMAAFHLYVSAIQGEKVLSCNQALEEWTRRIAWC